MGIKERKKDTICFHCKSSRSPGAARIPESLETTRPWSGEGAEHGGEGQAFPSSGGERGSPPPHTHTKNKEIKLSGREKEPFPVSFMQW